jgi:carbohydrate binding protein with CBM30 domain
MKRARAVLISIFLMLSSIAFARQLTSLSSSAAQQNDEILMIADFNRSVQNLVGGYHNRIERAPSLSTAIRVSDICRGSGRSLRISADQKPGGLCGVWMSFYDFKSQRRFIDVSRYSYLSFWVKGEKGGEHFTIKLETSMAREEAVVVGPIAEFLPDGVTNDWQEVLIPNSRFSALDSRRMAVFSIDFPDRGAFTVYVDDISFKKDKDVATPVSSPIRPRPATPRLYARAAEQGMGVRVDGGTWDVGRDR